MRFCLVLVGFISQLLVSCGSPNVVATQSIASLPSKPAEKAELPEVSPVAPVEDADAVYQMRQMHLSEWIDKAKRDCERTRSTDAYLPERDGFPPDEITLVKTRCAESVEVGMRGDAWIKSMSACADRFVRANGKGKHECRLSPKDVPDLPPELFDVHKAACTASCARAGVDNIDLKKERLQFVHCCDGTVSPSCTYASLHRGCCSGHQGVCIE